jgi:endonuclease YncB( thermonuclease family)
MRHVVTYVFLCLGLTPGALQAATVSGQASVMDGDTLEMHGQRIRLHGIDAPETPQHCYLPDGRTWRCGHTAARRLQDFIGSKTVTCAQKDRDRYGRIVAVCFAGGEDLGAWLVEHGWWNMAGRWPMRDTARRMWRSRNGRQPFRQGYGEAGFRSTGNGGRPARRRRARNGLSFVGPQ